MPILPFNPLAPITPSRKDAEIAGESSRRLARHLSNVNGTVCISFTSANGTEEAVTVPTGAFRLLVTILAEMANGNPVQLLPLHAELTTLEAAEFLNISRPYLVRLLEQDEIPYRLTGTHRRIQAADLIEYKSKRDRRRASALEELIAQSEESGLYNETENPLIRK
jgi:excisionase family DNA binding protein